MVIGSRTSCLRAVARRQACEWPAELVTVNGTPAQSVAAPGPPNPGTEETRAVLANAWFASLTSESIWDAESRNIS